jgi:hypothetical protein
MNIGAINQMGYIYLGCDSPKMSSAPERKESVSREGSALGLILFVRGKA